MAIICLKTEIYLFASSNQLLKVNGPADRLIVYSHLFSVVTELFINCCYYWEGSDSKQQQVSELIEII